MSTKRKWAMLILGILLQGGLGAATLSWDANAGGTLGGAGNWDSTTANWYNGSSDVTWIATGTDALFAGTGGTVTLAAIRTVNSLTFDATYSLSSATNSNYLNLTTGTISVANGATATLTGVDIHGNSGLIKTGEGTLAYLPSAQATFTGGITVEGGIFSFTATNAFGSTTTLGGTVDGGTLEYAGTSNASTSRSFAVGNNGGTLQVDSATLTLTSALNDVSGASGGSLTKTGSGTLTLKAASTRAGANFIDAGTLALSTTGTLGTGAVTLASGATFDISAVTGSSFTLTQAFMAAGTVNATGKTLVVNSSAFTMNGSLAVTGALTLGSSDLATLSIASPTDFGKIAVSGLLTLGGTIDVTSSYGFSSGDSFDLLDWGTLDASAFNVATGLSLPTLSGGLSWDTSSFLSSGVVTVVPEPSFWGMLAMGGALCLGFGGRKGGRLAGLSNG